MSKITQEKKLKGKQAKIAKANEAKANEPTSETPKKPSILNYNKCCTCRYRTNNMCTHQSSPKHMAYVPRKLDACNSYKCKIG